MRPGRPRPKSLTLRLPTPRPFRQRRCPPHSRSCTRACGPAARCYCATTAASISSTSSSPPCRAAASSRPSQAAGTGTRAATGPPASCICRAGGGDTARDPGYRAWALLHAPRRSRSAALAAVAALVLRPGAAASRCRGRSFCTLQHQDDGALLHAGAARASLARRGPPRG